MACAICIMPRGNKVKMLNSPSAIIKMAMSTSNSVVPDRVWDREIMAAVPPLSHARRLAVAAKGIWIEQNALPHGQGRRGRWITRHVHRMGGDQTGARVNGNE